MKFTKRASTILILEILKKYSDEENYLTQADIIDLIKKEYDLNLERKSVSQCLNLLKEVNYDIVSRPSGGYALIDKPFNESQIKYLIDLVMSSKSLSGNHAIEIANTLKETLAKNSQTKYKYISESKDITRTQNKEVFYTIDVINEAINKEKWIGFKYLTFDNQGKQTYRFNGYVYHCSPCALINNQGKYYLLGYRRKYDVVNVYRVDYIKEIEIMEERERIPLSQLKEFQNYKSISDYINDHIYMFGGNVIKAKLEIFDPSSLTYIYDWFGKNAKFANNDGKMIVEIKCNERALYYWVMQYSNIIKVVDPPELKEKVLQGAKDIIKKYQDD